MTRDEQIDFIARKTGLEADSVVALNIGDDTLASYAARIDSADAGTSRNGYASVAFGFSALGLGYGAVGTYPGWTCAGATAGAVLTLAIALVYFRRSDRISRTEEDIAATLVAQGARAIPPKDPAP